MKISMHTMAVDSFAQGLESLAQLLDKGAAYGKEKKLDLVNARLAPDMFTLAQQVQQACHYAKDAVGRLSGRAPVAMDVAGSTFAELKSGIEKTINQVRAVPPTAFDNAEERDCTFDPPNTDFTIPMDGLTFLKSWALPHFYFHLVTAYDILRHKGVDIGKRDYANWIGALVRPKP